MQEQTTFLLSEEFLNQDTAVAALYQELNRNIKSIEELLVSYHFKSRGRVYQVAVDQSSLELLQPLMGRFIATYSIGQFNACADVDYNERAAMEMLVDIDPKQKKAIITGEFIPEREPDEF